MPRRWLILLKLRLWLLCLSPVILLAWKATHDELGANPLSEVTFSTGHWSPYQISKVLRVS